MKRLLIFLITSLLISGGGVKSQTISVCGTDTVILTLSNYQYGTIQWEESIDSINWEPIPGANDTVYTFFPTETMYYRAVAGFYDCPPEYSAITHIQLPPVAYAGPDRIVSTDVVKMTANKSLGEYGIWSVISGTGGSFTDVHDPVTSFYGLIDSIYHIVWTLSNSCGTSTDTVTVQFLANEYTDHIVVVDSTDQILSDSMQHAQGIYIIKFSAPVPVMNDSTVLIGLVNYGFLRKVDSFIVNTDTFTLLTSQGNLEDFTISGAYDLAQTFDIDSTLKKSGGFIKLNHLPTRHELLTNPMYKSGNFFYIVDDHPDYVMQGVSYEKNFSKSGKPLIGLSFNETLISTSNISIKLSGHYNFTPNLIAELDYKNLRVRSFKMGMYNGVIDRNYKFEFDAQASASLIDESFTLFSMQKNILFFIGGVPVWIQAIFTIDGNIAASVSGAMNVTHEYNKTSTYLAALEYKDKSWDFPYSKTENVQTDNSFVVTGNFNQTFDIGPNLTFKLYGIVGPYIDSRLTEEFNLCMYNTNWQGSLDIGGDLSVGAKASVLGFTLFDISKTWSQGFYNLKFPYQIQKVAGDNQTYTMGQPLNNPVKIKVKSNKGFSVPGVFVRFQPKSGGTVQNSLVITNIHGEAEAIWYPGGSQYSLLEVSVLDCDGKEISNSPLIFMATDSNSAINCNHSSLSAHVVFQANKVKPAGVMGVPPYLYSTNGVNYSPIAPEITPVSGQTIVFYVKDNTECIATVSYTPPANICANSNLFLNAQVKGNVIEAYGENGNPPYLYSLNNATGGYGTSSIFQNVPLGVYTVYVKDSTDCIASNTVVVSGNNPPIIAEFHTDQRHVTVGTPVHFQDLSNSADNWYWEFGDNTTSTQQNPLKTYSSPGIYTVKLTAMNAFGSDSITKSNYITVSSIPPGNPCPGTPTITDINGNVYNTVLIGGQCWMKENLKVSNYRNGTPIPNVTSDSTWLSLSTGAMCWYNNDSDTYANTYGALYNWFAVSDPNEICPLGWHVPTDAEWEVLIDFLGGWSVAGGLLKSIANWNSPNTGATDFTGFTAFPGGMRNSNQGNFIHIGNYGWWWSSTEATVHSTTYAWYRRMTYDTNDVIKGCHEKVHGYSVRCLKDI